MCIFHERHVCLHPVHFIVMLPLSPTLVITVLFHINSFLQFSQLALYILLTVFTIYSCIQDLIILIITLYVTALLPTRGGMLYIVLHKNHP